LIGGGDKSESVRYYRDAEDAEGTNETLRPQRKGHVGWFAPFADNPLTADCAPGSFPILYVLLWIWFEYDCD
jgi:hypothetical protein